MVWKSKYAFLRHRCYKNNKNLEFQVIQITEDQKSTKIDQINQLGDDQLEEVIKFEPKTDHENDLEMLWNDDDFDDLEIWE